MIHSSVYDSFSNVFQKRYIQSKLPCNIKTNVIWEFVKILMHYTKLHAHLDLHLYFEYQFIHFRVTFSHENNLYKKKTGPED